MTTLHDFRIINPAAGDAGVMAKSNDLSLLNLFRVAGSPGWEFQVLRWEPETLGFYWVTVEWRGDC